MSSPRNDGDEYLTARFDAIEIEFHSRVPSRKTLVERSRSHYDSFSLDYVARLLQQRHNSKIIK